METKLSDGDPKRASSLQLTGQPAVLSTQNSVPFSDKQPISSAGQDMPNQACKNAESVCLEKWNMFKHQPLLEQIASAESWWDVWKLFHLPSHKISQVQKNVKTDRSNICSVFMAERTKCRHRRQPLKTLAMHFQSRPSHSRIAHEGARFFWTPVHAQAVCDTIWAEGQGLNTYQIRPNWKRDWQCTLGDSCWSLVIFSDLWWCVIPSSLTLLIKQCGNASQFIITPWIQRLCTFTSWWSEASILIVSTIHRTPILLWSAIECASVQGSGCINTGENWGAHKSEVLECAKNRALDDLR